MSSTDLSAKVRNPLNRRLYGRRQSKPLRKERAQAFDALLPVLSIPGDLLTEKADLDPAGLFARPFERYCFEIGFGAGEHLTALLRQFPDTGFIGAEPYVNGMGAFLRDIYGGPVDNIRVLMHDALRIVHSLQDSALDKLYVLNPDPWPKTRHHRRRIINQENLNAFSRILKPGGELVMATDVGELAEWMQEQCTNHPAFEQTPHSRENPQIPPQEWIETRYAFKGRNAGRKQTFLIFKKI